MKVARTRTATTWRISSSGSTTTYLDRIRSFKVLICFEKPTLFITNMPYSVLKGLHLPTGFALSELLDSRIIAIASKLTCSIRCSRVLHCVSSFGLGRLRKISYPPMEEKFYLYRYEKGALEVQRCRH